MEDAENFNPGTCGEFAVKNEVACEFCDDPGANVFVAAEVAYSAQSGVAGQEIEIFENSFFDAIRGIGVVGADVIVNYVNISYCLFGKDELSHGHGGGRRRVGADLSGRPHQGCLCPHPVL